MNNVNSKKSFPYYLKDENKYKVNTLIQQWHLYVHQMKNITLIAL